MQWIKKKPLTTLVIVLLIIIGVLFIVNETRLFTNDINYTFKEAVQKQTAGDALHTKSEGLKFVEASKNDIADAMKVENDDSDLEYMDISEPVNMSEEEVNEILKGKGILEDRGQDFLEAQDKYDVNVIYLISHANIETGEGQSELAEGLKEGKKRYYNFFGIGAFDSNALKTGSTYAQQADWTSPKKAILGGAKFIRQQYFDNHQISLYQMRWNPKEPATNQYASDIDWSAKIASQMENYYDHYGLKKENIRKNYYKH